MKKNIFVSIIIFIIFCFNISYAGGPSLRGSKLKNPEVFIDKIAEYFTKFEQKYGKEKTILNLNRIKRITENKVKRLENKNTKKVKELENQIYALKLIYEGDMFNCSDIEKYELIKNFKLLVPKGFITDKEYSSFNKLKEECIKHTYHYLSNFIDKKFYLTDEDYNILHNKVEELYDKINILEGGILRTKLAIISDTASNGIEYLKNNSFIHKFELISERKIKDKTFKIYERKIREGRIEFKLTYLENNIEKIIFDKIGNELLRGNGDSITNKINIIGIYNNKLIFKYKNSLTFIYDFNKRYLKELDNLSYIIDIKEGKNGIYILKTEYLSKKYLYFLNKENKIYTLYEDEGFLRFGRQFYKKGITVLKDFELLSGGKVKLYLEEYIDDKNTTKKVEKIIDINNFVK